jgi:GAF domain-containing protein
MLDKFYKFSADTFPYQTQACIKPIVDYWRSKQQDTNPLVATLVRETEKLVQDAPELLLPITDESIVERHRHVIEFLMAAVFPPVMQQNELSAAVTPFGEYSFFHTPRFAQALLNTSKRFVYPDGLDRKMLLASKVFSACCLILEKFYGVENLVDKSASFQVLNRHTGLTEYYKTKFDVSFVEVKALQPLRPLSKQDIQYLLNNYQDLDTWLQYLPADAFCFEGFTIVHLVDITDQELVSAIKYSLVETEALTSQPKFDALQYKLRSLLRRPAIRLGIGALERRRNNQVSVSPEICHSFVFNVTCGIECSGDLQSFHERFVREARPLILEDLLTASMPDLFKQRFLEIGIRNMVFIPLYAHEEFIGVLELASTQPNDLNSLSLMQLMELLPLFALAVQQSFNERKAKIESIIKEKFTAIHPTVEWRFVEAAMNLLEKQQKEATAQIEPIVFPDVYPLYGASDIRHSSVERNKAIQQDLSAQLSLAKKFMEEALALQPLPIFEKLNFSMAKHISRIKNGLLSDAETSVHEFLRRDFEPVIKHLVAAHPALQPFAENYLQALDPELGVVYQHRKDFEQSLTLINETLSAYIEEEEAKAQAMFPHYFEKYKTDGIEYNMYMGASLVEEGNFDPIYLKNMRLWQLITMCEIARRTKALQSRLKIPLETTQLILVHSLPLSIRFRTDERHFDVDGAYNIRYEIVKKRIDKAMIKGTNERLTQPGKIVIIYSQLSEALEYNNYIEYLQEISYLTGPVERVELEDLQGVQGLKAIRVEVNQKHSLKKQKTFPDAVLEMVKNYSEVE